MKKFIAISLIVLLSFSVSINTFAKTLENLPVTVSSNQWKVEIAEPDNDDPQSNKSDKPDLYNLYSLDINNIGKDNVELVRVEAYRDHPGSTSEYELFTESIKTAEPMFHHSNFPLFTKATRLKVIVTWIDKNDNSVHKRKFREEFIFEL
ncbi:hypothetical protein [Cytobacillus purgationiresistens]|uniref:Uncharacterized protein n=1 Tax=Cytobacillus purgationiresistens TaxID=863449 RepID=A0ABU0ACC8_9BACI|nr:hypothetical protein [Cytobacillus purgationiresistens]MDQ0268892.1 hypothetical protein [Cytobacillus purgationiresistens]